jgi:hypothetical protein
MTPSTGQSARTRRWGQVEKNLRKLHRRGLRDPQLDDLNELVAIAHNLSSKPTEREKVIDALAQAIDACWGGAREEGPSLRDVMRLWFGLPAVDDSTAPDTRAMNSVERHIAAWKYWKGDEREEAEATFRTSKGTKRYETLAKKLVELEADAARSATALDALARQSAQAIPEPQQLAQPATTQQDSAPAITTVEPPGSRLGGFASTVAQLQTKRKIGLLLTAALAGIVAWALWSSSSSISIPPLGAIVNAQTGTWSMRAPKTPAEFPAGIGGGDTKFRGCDVSTEHPCRYSSSVPPLKAHVDDTLEFTVILNNSYNTAIPYIKLEAYVNKIGEGGTSSRELLHAGISTELAVGMSISWPSEGELGAGPTITRHAEINEVYIKFPRAGDYGLRYIPKTSTIHLSKPHFFHYLPDGIMEPGIVLQNVGQPTTCFPCAISYIRLVSFRTRVVRK